MTNTNQNSVYTLETADEKKLRYIFTGGLVLVFGVFSYFLLPFITGMIKNWIDFGVKFGQLLILVGIFSTLWIMKDVLIARYMSAIKKMTRLLIKTDLPGLLEVVVDNRRKMLAKFNVSVKKMLEAITLHVNKMDERKESMQGNLNYAKQYEKKSLDTSIDEHTRQKYKDSIAHYATEAAEDQKVLQAMQADKEKMVKSYNFFDRLNDNLERSTESVANTIGRLRDQLQTSSMWKEAALSASSLLGVSEFETITLEETRNKIAANESQVMSMIQDHETLLMKMEAENGIMDDAGQELLNQYSNKVDVFAFLEPSQTADSKTIGTDASWLSANKHLLGK